MREVSVSGLAGQIRISDEVLAIISGTAAQEVDGVVTSTFSADLSARAARRNFAKGVKVSSEGAKLKIDLAIIVKFGYKIHVIGEEVQKRIKTALETMVGMAVKEVNVNIIGIQFTKAPRLPMKN